PAEVDRIARRARAIGVGAGVAVDPQHAALERNHLFGAVTEVVEHVEYRFGEEELTAAIGLHPELVPEQLLPAIAAPVALHEDGIAVHWLAGPLRNQRAAGIEPPHLCGEVRLPSLSVAVGPGANSH